jgi:phosphoribosyl-ATP pyrophosphohydrolase
VIKQLYQVICDRRERPQADSYVSTLMAAGPDKILQKIGEETTEVILAAKNLETDNRSSEAPGANQPLIHEIADLTFHVMVLMAEQKIPPTAIEEELKHRFGVSGLTEKASRKP